MATLNTAIHFGVEKDIGSITPGRYADILLTSDLVELPIELVISAGEVAARDGKLMADIPPYDYPTHMRQTVKLGKQLAASDFDIQVEQPGPVNARVVGVVENQAPTRALERILAVKDGVLQMDRANDVCQLSLVERHRGTGQVTNGLVSGFGFDVPCAIASTVAHDSHHMIVAGTDKENMALATNRLGEIGGGVVVFKEGEEIALVELPIAGLMSTERAEIVAAKGGPQGTGVW